MLLEELNEKKYAVYQGPKIIAGPFDSEEEANLWVIDYGYKYNRDVFVDVYQGL